MGDYRDDFDREDFFRKVGRREEKRARRYLAELRRIRNRLDRLSDEITTLIGD